MSRNSTDKKHYKICEINEKHLLNTMLMDALLPNDEVPYDIRPASWKADMMQVDSELRSLARITLKEFASIALTSTK